MIKLIAGFIFLAVAYSAGWNQLTPETSWELASEAWEESTLIEDATDLAQETWDSEMVQSIVGAVETFDLGEIGEVGDVDETTDDVEQNI